MMGVRRLQVFTKRQHAGQELRAPIADILGIEIARVHASPVGEGASVGLLTEPGGNANFEHALWVLLYDDTVAPNVTTDIAIAVPLARVLNDEIVCTPTGLPLDADDPENIDLWAVVDPQGVVRLGREIEDEDEEVVGLDIDPTPVEI